jgi:hypothetical protein
MQKRLRDRWADHKSDFKKWQKGVHCNLAIYPYFEKYQIENFKMILIKEYKVADTKQLRAYEQLWMNKIINCNKQNAISFLLTKHYDRVRNTTEEAKTARREYYHRDVEKSRAYDRQRYPKRKERMLEQSKLRVICKCGTNVCKGALTRHMKSQIHLNKLQALTG